MPALHADSMDDFLARIGARPVRPIRWPADGQIVRFRCQGDKAGSRNWWAVQHSQPVPWGRAGNWRDASRFDWLGPERRPDGRKGYTAKERQEQRRQRDAAVQAAQALQREVWAQAAQKAKRLWELARPATNAHPYLRAKGVNAYGIRQLGERLVIPARGPDGELRTLQFIEADGTKRFLTGGAKGGSYCAIGRPAGSDFLMLVCEGYATGASLHEASGNPVAVAFDAGNLVRVAMALRAKFPRAGIVICGDNDTQTPGNPGATAAHNAAHAVGGLVVLPSFKGAHA